MCGCDDSVLVCFGSAKVCKLPIIVQSAEEGAKVAPVDGLQFLMLPAVVLQVVAARNFAVANLLPVKDFLDHASYDCGSL